MQLYFGKEHGFYRYADWRHTSIWSPIMGKKLLADDEINAYVKTNWNYSFIKCRKLPKLYILRYDGFEFLNPKIYFSLYLLSLLIACHNFVISSIVGLHWITWGMLIRFFALSISINLREIQSDFIHTLCVLHPAIEPRTSGFSILTTEAFWNTIYNYIL